jgi:FKBP-type peptidyl-prolyl cis-trans isomerase
MTKSSVLFASAVMLGLLGCKATTPPISSGEQESLKAAEQSGDKSGAETEGKPKTAAAAKEPGKEAAQEGAIAAPPDVAKPPADAEKTTSGLASKVLAPGKGGDKPMVYDKVTVHYTGWTTDGKMFDSSVQRGSPATFDVKGVIAGWTEGLQLMTVGEKRRMWIPEALAYQGRPGSPQGMLVFDVELINITKGEAPIPAPPDVAAPPADAQKTKSGLAHKLIAAGTSKDKPHAWDRVTVNYTGWTSDGVMFDSSVKRGQPAQFQLDKVIPGWTEGVALMATGEKRRLWVPEELAYKGATGAPKGMLVFDVELLAIQRLPEPPAAPKDVAAPPKSAKHTASGLAYQVLKKGTGKTHPTAASQVKVHYSGWTTDGKMFDSSVARGEPITFPLGGVIPGWTEGVQLMVEGEKTRFWIPEELAYKGRPGAPAGMLVFDVELLKIE